MITDNNRHFRVIDHTCIQCTVLLNKQVTSYFPSYFLFQDGMKNSSKDIQEQFELLYRNICQIKEDLQAPLIYDSSGQNSEYESCSDDDEHHLFYDSTELPELSKQNNTAQHVSQYVKDTGTSEITPINETVSPKTSINLEENSCSPLVDVFNQNDSISFTISTVDQSSEPLESSSCDINNNAKSRHLKIAQHNSEDTSDTDTRRSIGESLNLEFQNSQTTLTNRNKANCVYDSSCFNAKQDQQRANAFISKQSWTRSCIFNIKPRRRLHEYTFVDSRDEKDIACAINEGAKPYDVIRTSTKSLELAQTMVITDCVTKTDVGDLINAHPQDSFKTEQLKYLSFESGYISFRDTSHDDWSDSASLISSDENVSTPLEELQYLKFQGGIVSFCTKSDAFDPDALGNSYSDDDDIMSEDGTYGFEKLFDEHDANIDNNTYEFDYRLDENLEGITELFTQSVDITDTENANENKNMHPSDSVELKWETEKTISLGTDSLNENEHVMQADKIPADLKQSVNMKANEIVEKTENTQYHFAGVVLLNALPSLLTSSLFPNMFSTPSYRNSLFQTFPLRSWSHLSSSDFAKISFSSQELPIKNISYITCSDPKSHFETVSTSSKESSLESVCEG